MPQSHAQIYVHLVFSTKNRTPFIDPNIRPELFAYLSEVCRNLDVPTLRVGGVSDHVHLLARMSRTITLAEWVGKLKSVSSQWMKTKGERNCEMFQWQRGYGAFSISPGHVDPVMRYIMDQEKHHRHESFQDEMRRLFTKYQIPYDERYVWD